MARQRYATDLSDGEWRLLEPCVPPVKWGGRPAVHTRREIVNAILYVLRSGCAWRLLPHDLPPWQTVYHYFRLWRKEGIWERTNAALRDETRRQVGRDAQPSGAILDSQSVRTTEKGGFAATTAARR